MPSSARSTPVELVRLVAVGLAFVLLSSTATALTASRDAVAEAEVRERLPALIAFVERERGLELRREVGVEVLDDDEFLDALYGDEVPLDEGGDVSATLEALDLVAPGTDVDEAVGEALDGGVTGFYDPASERLVVRAERLDPYVELVIVHELVHALQDQHFQTSRSELDDGSERALGFTSLVEGDAVRVEQAWRDAQPADVQAQIDAEEQRRFGGTEPIGLEDAIDGTLAFPYVAGPALVEALLAQGGQQRLDAVFSFPPLTSEQVLHPELVGEAGAVSPPAPDGDGERVDEGVLGELGLAQLLGLDATDGGPQVGWEGDRYATFDDGDTTCTLATVVMDAAAARDALVDALREVGYDAEPTGAASLELAACVS